MANDKCEMPSTVGAPQAGAVSANCAWQALIIQPDCSPLLLGVASGARTFHTLAFDGNFSFELRAPHPKNFPLATAANVWQLQLHRKQHPRDPVLAIHFHYHYQNFSAFLCCPRWDFLPSTKDSERAFALAAILRWRFVRK